MPDGQFPSTDTEHFDLLQFMTGELTGWGAFEDRFGRVKERFEITATGRWTGNRLILDEYFVYASGRSERRVWTLTPTAPAAFIGTCDDCKGEAHGQFGADFATLDYTFLLKTSARTLELRFADKFFPIGKQAVLNRTQVTKWGIKVGEVSAIFCRAD